MKNKVIKLKESDLARIVKRVLSERQDDTSQPTTTTGVNPYVEELKTCMKEHEIYQPGGRPCQDMIQEIYNGIIPTDERILECSQDLLKRQQGFRSDGKDETGFICCIANVARNRPRGMSTQ